MALKLDNFVDIEWFAVLWLFWIVLACISFISIGALLLVTLSICSYYYKETSISDIYSSAWIFYITAIGSTAVSLFSYDIFNNNFQRMCIWIIAYLISFIIITQLLKVHLLKYWRSIFIHNEQISIPNSLSNSGPLPLPPSQAGHMNISTKIIRVLKLPPKQLVRMSSSYFLPQPSSKSIQKNARTMSHDVKKSIENVHFRSLSSVPADQSPGLFKHVADFSFVDKKCSICCENECNSVLMDCGHGGICVHCANLLLKSKGVCHMCRAPINQVLRIKLEPSKILNVIGTNSNLDH